MSEWKETEVGRIPSSWESLHIGDFGDVTKLAGFEYTKHITYVEDGEIIALRALNVREGNLDLSDVKRIYKDISDNLIRSKLFKGDILFTYVGANIGQFALVPENDKFHLAPNICRIRCGKKCEPYFLYSYFRTDFFRNSLEGFSHGSSQPTMPMGSIRQIPIPIPPLPEQRAIAKVLSSLDDKIDLLHRQNKTLEQMAETLFRQWFVEEGDENWEEVDLDYVTERITDGSHNSPVTVEIGLPMASVKDMHAWGISTKNCRHISIDDFETLIKNDCRPLKNDIIIAKDGSYLKHVFVAEQDLNVVILSSIAILRPNGMYNPILLSIFLKLTSTRAELENIVTGAVIPRIVLKDFKKFPIKLPTKDLQDKALVKIRPLIEKCWTNIKQISTLEKLRDTLLPKLMSGEVKINS